MNPLSNVTAWADEVQVQLAAFSLTACVHESTILALIHVESAGDADARRPGSQFRGLLQIGPGYFQDAMEHIDCPERDTDRLMGDGGASIAATLAYMSRYADFHQWHPTLMAVAHKGGAGTCKMVRDEVRSGAPIHGALNYAESSIPVPHLREYVRRFEQARTAYAQVSAHRPNICHSIFNEA